MCVHLLVVFLENWNACANVKPTVYTTLSYLILFGKDTAQASPTFP